MKKPLVILAVIFVPIVVAAVSILVNHPSKSKVGNRKSEIRRIVSLSPNLTEIVFTLGLGGKVVAVSSNCDWPAETRAKPKVGSFWQPNTEAIIAAKPDLVVCESFEQQRAVGETLKRAGLNVLSLRVESVDELFTAISRIGQAAGCSVAAEQIIAGTKERLNQIRVMCSPAKKVKVLWVIQTEPLRLAGVNTFINEIIELAGGQNAIAPTVDQYPSVGTEEILICGAEVIIQSAMGKQDIPEQQIGAEEFWNRFPNLPAVKDKRIYVIDSDMVLRLGPRLPEGARAVAQCLHPELFTQPQTTSLQKEL